MHDLKASDYVHALRKYLSEIECEYPDVTIIDAQALLVDASTRLFDVIHLGGSPAQAVTLALGEQINAGLIPPWA